MHHYVAVDCHMWGAMLEHYQKHTKAGQHYAELRPFS